MSECSKHRAVDGYFDGKLAPALADELHAHLPGCVECAARYRRHMLLEKMDPSALGARERIARGLGLGRRPLPLAWPAGIAAAVAVAAAALLVVRSYPVPTDGQYAARGTVSEGDRARLLVYRAADDGAPVLASPVIGARDELAFAYENPETKKYLMIFGVDEHRHVYWYYPSWTTADEDPAAIAIEPGPGRRELHEAVRQALDGQHLVIHGLFTDAPRHVREVEAELSSGGVLASPGDVDATSSFEVAR